MRALTVKDSKYSIPIKFWWAFARPNVDHLLEDTGKRYLYKGEKDKLTTVADFSEDMHSHVNEEYVRTREAEIVKVLEMTCLSGIKGVPGIIASFLFSVEEIRLHFRLNIIDNSLIEYGEPKSEFVEAIGKVEKTLFQHYLVEFMHNLFRFQLTWLDSGGGESKIIIETLLKLLYGNGTSVLVTFKEAGLWSWQHFYRGGEPELGVVYAVRDRKHKWYQAIFYKRDEVVEKGENTVNFKVHFVNWTSKYDEVLGLSDLTKRIKCRGIILIPHLPGNPSEKTLGGKWRGKGKTKFYSHAFRRWITSLSGKQRADILAAIPPLSKGLINCEDVASIVGGPVDFIRIIIVNLNLQLNLLQLSNNSLSEHKPDGDTRVFWNQLLKRWSSLRGAI